MSFDTDGLRAAASRHRGFALREFVAALLARNNGDLHATGEELDRGCKAWVRRFTEPTADGEVLRVARRFALLAEAGKLAVEVGVLPWAQSDVDWAVKEVFHAWTAARGGQGSAEVAAVKARLRELITRHGASRFQWLARPGEKDDEQERLLDDSEFKEVRERVIDRAGYWRNMWVPAASGGHTRCRQFLIFPETWSREILCGVDPGAVRDVLIREKVIEEDHEGNPTIVVKVSGKSKRFYATLGGTGDEYC